MLKKNERSIMTFKLVNCVVLAHFFRYFQSV